MNKRRSKRNLDFGSVLFLIFVAVVLASVGVFHAYIKNQQVEVARLTDKTEQRIGQHELDIKALQMRLDQQLNRYYIRDLLKQSGSDLVAIPVMEVETIDAHRLNHPLPDLARRGP